LISFLSDEVIFQRYVEMEGQMRKVMTVVKMRGSDHSKDLRLYDVTADGLVVGDPLYDYRGIVYRRCSASPEQRVRRYRRARQTN